MISIIRFATAVLSNSTSTFILDDEDTRNQILRLRKKEMTTALEKLDSANTLLDARQENMAEGEEASYDNNMESLSVVAFYLISRESGSLFGKVTNLIGFSECSTQFKGVFKGETVVSLVENFTESLLSIKHLGARDSIANGLTNLCTRVNHIPGREYSDLTRRMLTKILASLRDN